MKLCRPLAHNFAPRQIAFCTLEIPLLSLFFFLSEKTLYFKYVQEYCYNNNEQNWKGLLRGASSRQNVNRLSLRFCSNLTGFTGLTQCNPVIFTISLRLSILKQLLRVPTFGMPYHFELVPRSIGLSRFYPRNMFLNEYELACNLYGSGRRLRQAGIL